MAGVRHSLELNRKRTVPVAILSLVLVVSLFNFSPVAHALSNGIDAQNWYYDNSFGHINPCANVGSCTITNPLTSGVQSGDLLVLFTACNPSTSTVSTVTDTRSDAWVHGKSQVQSIQNSTMYSLDTEGWYSLSANPSAGSIGDVSLSFSATVTNCQIWIVSVNYVAAGLADSDGVTKTFVTTATMTSKAFSSPSNTYYIAFESAIARGGGIVACQGLFTPTAPLVGEAGSSNCLQNTNLGEFRNLQSPSDGNVAFGGADVYESSLFSGALTLTQTQYGIGQGHDTYVAVFLRFGPSITAVNPYFVGCTFYQMQCWWYPLFFLGVYSSFYIGVATAFRVSTKAKIYMMFSGLSMAGLISIILGILTIALPLLTIAGSVVYVLRMKGVI